ncbi:MAG: hypothetical protein ABW080_14645 [Candidatus Thiodiazotropha sp.]
MVFGKTHQTLLTHLIMIQVMLMVQMVQPSGLRQQETESEQSL